MMVHVKSFLVFLTISVTFAIELPDDESSSFSETGRKFENSGQQDWRAVGHFHASGDTSGWIPSQQQDEIGITTKRRRIRKRKRRPPVIFSLTEDVDNDFVYPSIRKQILRPQRLDMVQPDSWEEMSAEVPQKPSNRRRVVPHFEASSMEQPKQYAKIRNPFTALQEEEEKQKKKQEETNPTKDLKNLLKATGGTLSLSEILQQKNLSLAELLMGKKEAISAILKEKPETTTPAYFESEDQDSIKYKRLPPSVALKKTQNKNRDNSEIEELTSQEILGAQRKRLSLLHGHKEDKVEDNTETETTTEKQIFVPSTTPVSNNKSQNHEDMEEIEISTTTSPQSTIGSNIEFNTNKVSYKPLLLKSNLNLPITSAKLNKFVSTKSDLAEHNSVLPPKAVKIDISEVLGLQKFQTTTREPQLEDLPFKMSIDLESFVVEDTTTKKPPIMKDQKAYQTTVTSPSVENSRVVTAKEEIMEILNNAVDRENLSRILRNRNMTVDELVEQRERGSSQLHLADIFHNNTKEPEAKDEPLIEHVNTEHFNNFPVFNRKPKNIVFTTTSANTVVKKELAYIHPEVITIKPKPEITITSFPTYKIETTKNLPQESYVSIWKELYNNENRNRELPIRTSTIIPKTTTDIFNYEELQIVEELDNHLDHEVTNDRLNVDLLQNDEEFINLPTGVKSAILASFAIIGLSLMVFLTILVIFKWTQRHKKRLNYNDSFTGSKIRSPILETPNRRSLKRFMTETLGRNKKIYYKNHLQSMSDSIWDTEKKPCYI